MTQSNVLEGPGAAAGLYLDLLTKCLTREVFGERYVAIEPPPGRLAAILYPRIRRWLGAHGLDIVRPALVEAGARTDGRDWPLEAETMIGRKRLDNLDQCVIDILRRGVPGDLIETGVWRGGATILMQAVLKAYGDAEWIVRVVDSFRGLPKPDVARYPADAGDRHWMDARLAVPLAEVNANFARYGLLDGQVRFLEGWFSETLPDAPLERLAVIRLDGNMCESTMDALRHLYPRLSVGGQVIVDDYGAIPGCRAAVEENRTAHRIGEPLERIDWTGVFWRRLQ